MGIQDPMILKVLLFLSYDIFLVGSLFKINTLDSSMDTSQRFNPITFIPKADNIPKRDNPIITRGSIKILCIFTFLSLLCVYPRYRSITNNINTHIGVF